MTKILDDINDVYFQPKLGHIGEVATAIEDINQCISIILSTPKGSVAHRPEFGSNIYKYIDYPIAQAIPNIIKEAINAIRQWEPRVDIKSVRASVAEAQVILQIAYELAENVYEVEVKIG